MPEYEMAEGIGVQHDNEVKQKEQTRGRSVFFLPPPQPATFHRE
jgi:hypothetical protein